MLLPTYEQTLGMMQLYNQWLSANHNVQMVGFRPHVAHDTAHNNIFNTPVDTRYFLTPNNEDRMVTTACLAMRGHLFTNAFGFINYIPAVLGMHDIAYGTVLNTIDGILQDNGPVNVLEGVHTAKIALVPINNSTVRQFCLQSAESISALGMVNNWSRK